MVKRKTASDRVTRFLRKLNLWCQGYRHAPMAWQHTQLCHKLRGHFGYYGITGNSRSLRSLRYRAVRIWRKWLSRRSRTSKVTWERFNLLLKRYPLPSPTVRHAA